MCEGVHEQERKTRCDHEQNSRRDKHDKRGNTKAAPGCEYGSDNQARAEDQRVILRDHEVAYHLTRVRGIFVT
jgi:hypothetical protein